MTETEQIFKTLEQIADAITKTFPRSFEVVVHDLSTPQKSIKHMAGEVTRRKKGGPVTDLVVKSLHKEGKDIKDRYNYKTKTKDGRTLKSTTSFIRNKEGEVIAAFCINFDMTDYLNAVHALEMFTTTTDSFDTNTGNKTETFTTSINETIEEIFYQAISKIGKECTSMSMEEKIDLVKELECNGVFNIKGSIEQIAILMGVSRYTVYNYLKKSRTMQDLNCL
ncbi:MAG: helix-turn-helix transcriptional regulator [Desulfohalobiaceae bacterium]|nr:helix-turn-helix transcriptional regulator [Desulfohalobiaceae bacterium]